GTCASLKASEMHREIDIHPHVSSERADLFHSEDPGATELEYLALLRSLVLATKPTLLFETGAWNGAGTEALAAATMVNGFGRLITLDLDADACQRVRERLNHAKNVDVVNCNSLDYIAQYHGPPFDFAFLDSQLPTRVEELN